MIAMPTKPVRIHIFSCPAHLPIVRAALEKMCQMLGFDSEAVGKIVLSTDEALTNIIHHAYMDDQDQPIEIEVSPIVESDCTGVKIAIRDYGRRCDPAMIRSRDLGDIRPGGLGVHIMTQCMDKLEYRPADGGGTVLTMVKALPVAQGKVK
jgi:anti-sigma regulatory factor (Ser/Thr protein kinase)